MGLSALVAGDQRQQLVKADADAMGNDAASVSCACGTGQAAEAGAVQSACC
jgi:hypothetical protein